MKFKSQVFTQVSGSVGGLTYSHNQGGLYTRARTIPINPNTVRQQAVRTALGSMVVHWTETLTPAQRGAWDTYGANTPTVDRLGDPLILSGQQMFLRCNIIRTQLGLTVVAAAPVIFNLGNPISSVISMVLAAGVLTVSLQLPAPGTSTSGRKILQIGNAVNASRNFYKSPYRLAFSSNVVASSQNPNMVITIATDWEAPADPVIGDILPTRTRIVYDDGRVSQDHQETVTVA